MPRISRNLSSAIAHPDAEVDDQLALEVFDALPHPLIQLKNTRCVVKNPHGNLPRIECGIS